MAKEQAKPLRKPGEISKLLNVSTVTIRKYTTEFSEHLSPSARNETSRRFTPEDVQVLKVARQLLSEGFTYAQARLELPGRLPVAGEVFESEEPGSGEEPAYQEEPVPSAIQPLEFFTAFVEHLRTEHQSTIQAKDETIETLQKDKKRLQQEVDWLRLPFYRKWFRKPPGE